MIFVDADVVEISTPLLTCGPMRRDCNFDGDAARLGWDSKETASRAVDNVRLASDGDDPESEVSACSASIAEFVDNNRIKSPLIRTNSAAQANICQSFIVVPLGPGTMAQSFAALHARVNGGARRFGGMILKALRDGAEARTNLRLAL